MAKRKTNTQMIAHLINYSAHGDLAQLFIMNAIHGLAEVTVDAGVEAIPESDMVHPESWVAVAQEIKDKIEENWKL